ncbi:MAG: ABC transporter substrate-binding protein, partial [Deltaproteobacteria bacterium]|nr:ABC transporter substrate-binding protein [Deltaproteobacteria bacterium]
MNKVLVLLLSFLVLLAVAASGCSRQDEVGKGPIVVGSKIDTEGALLSQMVILMLRGKGFEVVDKSQFGPTSVVRKAIISSEIDMYPEYTGNGAFFFDEADSPVWKSAKQGYECVKELDKAQNNIVWLTPAPANNTWAIAV